MEPTPDAYASAFRRAQGGADALTRALSPAQFNWKPAPERWSVGQCLDHLNRLSERYLPEMEAAVAGGGPAGQPPFQYGLMGRLFVKGTSPEILFKVKTMTAMAPRDGALDPAEVLGAFRTYTDRYLGIIERARGLDLSKIRIRSPFLPRAPFLTFPLAALLEGNAGHELRHLDQAWRVTREAAFPKA
jgi:hypothetical protein